MADDATPTEGGKPGRPPKITPAMVEAIAAMLLQGQFRTVAARAVGISAVTFRRWMKAGKNFPEGLYGDFRRAVLLSEAEGERKALAAILAAGQDDASHLRWYLERKYPHRYGQFRGEIGELKRKVKAMEDIVAGLESINAGPNAEAEPQAH